MIDTSLAVVGHSIAKPEAMQKTMGHAQYADDLKLPRMAHCRLLRSNRPHARITSIDTTAARALPGVLAVITAADVPDVTYGILPVGQDEQVLCREKVRFVGDPLAAVAALDEQTADLAVALIQVEYDDLPPYLTLEDALTRPGEPVHAGKYGNAHRAAALEFGDVDAGFARADHVFTDMYFFQGNTHLPMEPHACVADWDATGKLTLWSSTQTPHYVSSRRTLVAVSAANQSCFRTKPWPLDYRC